ARERCVERAAAADLEAVDSGWLLGGAAQALVADCDHLLPPRTDAVLLGQDGDDAALIERGRAGVVEHREPVVPGLAGAPRDRVGADTGGFFDALARRLLGRRGNGGRCGGGRGL